MAISFAAVLALGTIWLLSSFFEDFDDDHNGNGLRLPLHVSAYSQ